MSPSPTPTRSRAATPAGPGPAEQRPTACNCEVHLTITLGACIARFRTGADPNPGYNETRGLHDIQSLLHAPV
jgi:hypothetical protein